VGIVQHLGSVEAHAHLEALFRKERAPSVVEQGAVGLQVIPALPTVRQVAPLELDGSPVEAETGQGRLAPVPDKVDERSRARFDELPHVALEDRVAHPEAVRSLVQASGIEVVAVAARQVARRSDGLGHDDEGIAGGVLIGYGVPRADHPRSLPTGPFPESVSPISRRARSTRGALLSLRTSMGMLSPFSRVGS